MHPCAFCHSQTGTPNLYRTSSKGQQEKASPNTQDALQNISGFGDPQKSSTSRIAAFIFFVGEVSSFQTIRQRSKDTPDIQGFKHLRPWATAHAGVGLAEERAAQPTWAALVPGTHTAGSRLQNIVSGTLHQWSKVTWTVTGLRAIINHIRSPIATANLCRRREPLVCVGCGYRGRGYLLLRDSKCHLSATRDTCGTCRGYGFQYTLVDLQPHAQGILLRGHC